MIRRPNKDLLGVSWTLWFLPSLFIRAVYRKLSRKKIENFSKDDLGQQEKIYFLWDIEFGFFCLKSKLNMCSIFSLTAIYVLLGFTASGYAFTHYSDSKKPMLDIENEKVKGMQAARYLNESMGINALEVYFLKNFCVLPIVKLQVTPKKGSVFYLRDFLLLYTH